MNIPLFQPYYDEKEEQAVAHVLRSRWPGLGVQTEKFERAFADYVGSRYAVALNSATAALHLSLILSDVRAGDEVLVPTMTFVSTAHAVEYLSAKPIFCDVHEDTLMIDFEDAFRRITPRTKAIIPVAYGGQVISFDPMVYDKRIRFIFDNAHAAGNDFYPKAKLACWSFHAVKNLAAGDGGMITMDDHKQYERAKKLRWLGIDKGTWQRTEGNKEYWWEYNVEEIGYKCHMNDITAAIALEQLRKLPLMNEQRRRLIERYAKNLEGHRSLIPPYTVGSSSNHLFGIRTPHRNELAMYLKTHGIATGVHYKPIHLYSCYGNKPVLPVAERVWREILTLPLFPELTLEQVDYICEKIREFLDGPDYEEDDDD
jgi:perosamine synthetase